MGVIHYRTSQSGIFQTEGQDITDLVLIAPILLAGGILGLIGKSYAKYFLILPPVTLIYTGISFGLGEEYGNPAYQGNVENFFGLYLMLIIGGLILLIGSFSLFSEEDAPEFSRKGLRIYVALMSIFLLIFAGMWISQIIQVLNTGNLIDGSYSAAPAGFWTVRYLDLGISIPVGLTAMFLLLSKPKSAYPLVLLFFGFFITLGTSVNAMAVVMVLNKDPTLASSSAGLVVFPVLGVLAYGGFFYLLKGKLHIRHPTSRLP